MKFWYITSYTKQNFFVEIITKIYNFDFVFHFISQEIINKLWKLEIILYNFLNMKVNYIFQKNFIISTISTITFFCVTEQHYVSILCANLCFSSTTVAWWLINKNVIFLLSRFIFACRLVLYLYACAVENPEILGFCTVSKSKGLRTDHKRVKKIETRSCSVTQTTITSDDDIYALQSLYSSLMGENLATLISVLDSPK